MNDNRCCPPGTGHALLALAAVATACLTPPARAGDRPFQAMVSAAAEEDDDRVWSVSTTAERLGAVRAVGIEAEYAFDPVTSIQFGYGRARERGTGIRAQAFEVEGKYLFNHIARDGWGWGVSLAHAHVKATGGGWESGNWELRLPVSWQVSREGGTLLHANLGWNKSRGTSVERFVGIAGETELRRGIVLFAELAREGEQTCANAGVRHWIKREKLAFDISLQRARGDGSRENGFVVGFSWYDL